METVRILTQLFRFTVINILIVFLITSCKREEDAWNEVRVFNSTNDTLVFFCLKNMYPILDI